MNGPKAAGFAGRLSRRTLGRMPSSIVFIDVEDIDTALVTDRFPGVTLLPGDASEEEIVKACAAADVVSTFVTVPFRRPLLDKLPRLKLLCTRSVGVDHIDAPACAERGIVVCHVPDYGAHVIAEHVFALLLSAVRRIPEGHERVKAGRFDWRGLRGMALKGKTIGIVGTGRIGRNVAKIAHGFGMTLLGYDLFPNAALEIEMGLRYVPLEELLSHSDVVTLHAPATKENHHLLDAAAFKKMKRKSVLVNTARGTLVDHDALLAALEGNGGPEWAVLDVLEDERARNANAALIAHPRVVVTPHVAFYTDDSALAMYEECFASIEEWQGGKEPRNAIKV